MCLGHDRVRAGTLHALDVKGVPLVGGKGVPLVDDKGVLLVDEAEPDDNEMPHRYKACEASASACTARIG